MSVFGVLSNRGKGHVVTTILIAMIAMLFTAISYGRWHGFIQAPVLLSLTSDKTINPVLGYITGWTW